MLDISKKVFLSLNEKGINYCHFKSNEHLEEGLNGETDLDILIDKNDRIKCEQIFKEIGLKRFEPTKIGEYPGVINWYGFDEKTGNLIHLHTHYNLITGKGLVKDYYIPWEKLLLSTSITESNTGIKITEPNLEYILLCTRIVVKRKLTENIKSKNKIFLYKDMIKEIEYLKEKTNNDILKKYIYEIYGEEDSNIILELMLDIENLSKKKFKQLDRIIRNKLSNSRRMPGIISTIMSMKNRTNRKINRDINKAFDKMLPLKKRSIEKGVSVAFVGIDGSGKSTVSKIIYKWIAKEFDTKRFYAGAGDGKKNIISTILINTYKMKNRTNTPKNNAENDSKNKRFKFYKFKNLFGAIAYYKILKCNIKNIKKANQYCNKGCFCLMDRFPQSSVESEHDGPKIQKYLNNKNFLIVKILAKKEMKLLGELENNIPKFDLLFKMKITPEIAIERKPDHNYEDLLKKSLSLDKIDFAVKKVIEIDATQKLEDVVLEVKKNIWELI